MQRCCIYARAGRLSNNKKEMQKAAAVVVLVLIIGVQALNIITATQILKFTKYADDITNKSYTAPDSTTQKYIYAFSFTMCASGLTAIIYTILLIVKMTNSTINAKLQEILFYVVGLLQFSYAVQIGLYVSKEINPYGPNGSVLSLISVYTDMYKITMADAIAQVICVPGSFVLTLNSVPSVTPSAKQTSTSELGLRS